MTALLTGAPRVIRNFQAIAMRSVDSIRTADTVASFKKLTDENEQIGAILRSEFCAFTPANVLDAGAGTGDISYKAWPDRRVLLLDLLDYSTFPRAPHHQRVRGDFFDRQLAFDTKFETILFSHVLQYLDDEAGSLGERVAELDAKFLLTVRNDNTDPVMRNILKFANDQIGDINAEADAYHFSGFVPTKKVYFTSTISADSHSALAKHFFAVVLDRSLDDNELDLAARLFRKLAPGRPELRIRQIVQGMARENR